jgi:hypothetical protein
MQLEITPYFCVHPDDDDRRQRWPPIAVTRASGLLNHDGKGRPERR